MDAMKLPNSTDNELDVKGGYEENLFLLLLYLTVIKRGIR
jgi:hypothetical protein